ncbi:MAG: FCD domain-containing protein [Desulfotignum sp.]|nr:FCD domain-containing protein [Desulfotignum sp.]MCF8086743.1 FCD domain-containing protein [Desulfotignum sp.]MCF8136491.1 FCD domain-containing protein [Desulfotignum sp.]
MALDNKILKRQASLSQQVATYLIDKIQKGDFHSEEFFPSETELCQSLNVSRTVIREALSRMKHDGYLISHRGSRTKVAKDTSGSSFRLETPAQKDEVFFRQMYELRAIIEPEAAAIAALRITKEGIKDLWKKLERLNVATESGNDATQESLDFHRAVIAASQNPIFTDLISWIEHKFWSFIGIYNFHDLKHAKEMYQIIEKEHESIIRSIETRDSKKARQVSRDHVIRAAERRNIEIILPD